MEFKFTHRGSNFTLLIHSSKALIVFRILLLSTSLEDVIISAKLSHSVFCYHSFSSPGPGYICLLIACVSIPAVKFNTSLKPSAKAESFSEEEAIKGMLARSSFWLIYWLADCGWFFFFHLKSLQTVIFGKQNDIWLVHVVVRYHNLLQRILALTL